MCDWIKGKTGYFIGFILCFGIVGLALYIQVKNNLEPCPLCISQRIVFMSLGLLFLIHMLLKKKGSLSTIWTLIEILTAVGGAGVAIRHWWLQVHKDEVFADCGVGFDYMFENFPLKKALMLVFRGTGDCASIDWALLGLTLPQLGLISFICVGLFAIILRKVNLS